MSAIEIIDVLSSDDEPMNSDVNTKRETKPKQEQERTSTKSTTNDLITAREKRVSTLLDNYDLIQTALKRAEPYMNSVQRLRWQRLNGDQRISSPSTSQASATVPAPNVVTYAAMRRRFPSGRRKKVSRRKVRPKRRAIASSSSTFKRATTVKVKSEGKSSFTVKKERF